MLKRIKLIFFILLSLLNAETPNSPINKSQQTNNRYTIDDIISMTLQSHPTIKMNKEIIKGSDAQLSGAKWGYYPTPSISSFQTANRVFGATLSVDQPLFTGGKLDANYDLALANKKSSEFALEDSAYTLVETLLENVKAYIQGDNSYKALLEGQKQLRILQGMVQRRVMAGVSSKADLELLMARLYQMESDLNLAKTKKEVALAQIELISGKEFDNKLLLELSAPVVNGTIKDAVNKAISTHPLLNKLEMQREYSIAEVDKAKASIWPTLSIKAQQDFGSKSMIDDIQSDRSPFAYLSVQASPGAGLSAKSVIESAQAKMLQVEQEKLVAKQSITNKVMFAYNDYKSATQRIESQKESVGSSQRVFASYTRLFLAGKRQWLDLVNSSKEVTQNEIAFSDAKAVVLISAYQLALYKGEIKSLSIAKKSIETPKGTKKVEPNKIEYKKPSVVIVKEVPKNNVTTIVLPANKADEIVVKPYVNPVVVAKKVESVTVETVKVEIPKIETPKVDNVKIIEKENKLSPYNNTHDLQDDMPLTNGGQREYSSVLPISSPVRVEKSNMTHDLQDDIVADTNNHGLER